MILFLEIMKTVNFNEYEVDSPVGKTLTVKGLIDRLKEFPEDMPVCDDDNFPINNVGEYLWEDTNYPYMKPECKFIKLN